MPHALLLALVLATGLSSRPAMAEFKPLLLFLQPDDAREPVGQLTFEANPLQSRGPVKLAKEAGAIGHPLLAVPTAGGAFEVFGCTHQEADTDPRTFTWRVFRGLTPDGYRLSESKEVFHNPAGPWLIESSLVRQESTGRLFFFTWSRHSEPAKGHAMWAFSSPDGLAWQPLSSDPLYTEHDAFGVMWDVPTSRFLIAQVTQQPFDKPFSDNIGAGRRRVLSIQASQDGLSWKRVDEAGAGGLITPDSADSPDVEFYRMQPFRYGDRYLGMADLYAASPLVPAKHGPHLTCEWWISPDAIRWQRPWRQVAAHGEAPYPVKMAPMWFGQEMLFWVGGQVFGLPEYRVASIGSRSNAAFSSRPFAMPARPLLLNASAKAGAGLFNQAYVTVELRDQAGRAIPGYEHDKCVLQGVDDTRVPLRWGDRDGRELAGRTLALGFRLRSARIYALGAE